MRIRAGVAGVGALAAVLAPVQATGQASQAGSVAQERPSRITVVDEVGDVWRADRRTDEWELVGEVPEIDVRRAVVRHGRRDLVVRTAFVDLQRGSRTTFWLGLELPGQEFTFSRIVARRGQMAGGHNLLDEPGGDKIDCPGLEHGIDRDGDTVTVRIPRSCLGDPAWVQANISAELVRRGAPNHPLADNAQNDQPSSNGPSTRVYAPRS